MSRPTVPGAGASIQTPSARDQLRLEPFRGWTFDPRRVRIEDVLCPPYDVIEPDEDATLRQRSMCNIVRVVRPRSVPGTAVQGDPYGTAAALLASWRDDGTLVRDDLAALYVYEQRHRGGHQLGVIGALGLRDPADGVIIPHEAVFPGPVADRLALITATNAQLEPILVTSDGIDDLAPWLAEIARTDPMLAAAPGDGTEHRLWRIDAVDEIAAVREALAPRRALIADGHHRYATYRRFQEQRRAVAAGSGPWDLGLALLVGTDAASLSLGPIHRTVRRANLPLPGDGHPDVAVTAIADSLAGDAGALLELLERPGATPPSPPTVDLIASDGRRAVRLRCRVRGVTDRDRLAAVVMSDVVLPQVFGVLDGDQQVEYHHDAAHAVAAGGVALLLPAPSLREVRALAEAGVTMPRKSTSFGPKPRSGLVLRTLDT